MTARTSVPTTPTTPEPTEETAGPHLSLEVLSAYYRRDLPKDLMGQVRFHVVLCNPCRALLLELARFSEDNEGPGRLSTAEVAAAWRQLMARHEAETDEGASGQVLGLHG